MRGSGGDVVVAGLVTGVHVLEDIKVAVPHKVAVRIPAAVALQSKDLWRSISQGRVFKLDGGSGVVTHGTTASADSARIGQLEAALATANAENKKLRQQLAESEARNGGLQQVLAGFSGQLQGIQGVLGRLENLPAALQGVVAVPQQQGVPVAGQVVQANPEVVGGEAPKFIPDIKPTDATTQIQVKKEVTDGSSLQNASSKLRQLRKS